MRGKGLTYCRRRRGECIEVLSAGVIVPGNLDSYLEVNIHFISQNSAQDNLQIRRVHQEIGKPS